ncbi:coiled-coil domain-containing protein AGAP005037-like isoform X2 [Watersipora subatra]|uniref:coiled-coil domain-containing protein AGAP005037-like isoform X2 n=1 Tax=Watersipora subatra TaxID=2589382 RepID=UPI00355B335B
MGFFGKKKAKHGELSTSKQGGLDEVSTGSSSDYTARHHERRQQLLKSPSYAKSVRFAPDISDDEGGFVTDSELEINRSTRYGSLRARPSPSMVTAPPIKSTTLDRTAVARSQSYDYGRSHSYSEKQSNTSSPLWASNGVARPHQNGSLTVDDDYMSDSSTASSFARGARLRSSLPILKHVTTKPVGLVFLTYQNETKKTILPSEIKNLDTIKAMFLRCFPQQLTPDMLNSPKRRFYILDRSSSKFFLLIHLQEVRDGTMLKLVDSDALTPSTVRRSHSAHSSLTTDAHYFSEPEFDMESSSRRYGQRPIMRMALTKETNIDEPVMGSSWTHLQSAPQLPAVSQPVYQKTGTTAVDHSATMPGHLVSSTRTTNNAGTIQGSYIPPQALQSTVHSTRGDPSKYTQNEELDNASISSKDSVTSRNRMAKMETQIANLTAMVQTAFTSRPGSSASDRLSELSYHSNRSSVSGASSSTPQPGVSIELQGSIKTASEKIKDLKAEFRQLKRIHEAQAESIQDTINDALKKIQTAVNGTPGASHSPLRAKRHAVDVTVDEYKKDQESVLNQISELEACVAELRSDVVSKRCHVNIAEVEALALNLSKATRSAADIKVKFPQVVRELKSVSEEEMDSVILQQDFIAQEPDKIEEALRRCKTVTNVLFTLKRLAAIDNHRTAVIPTLHTLPVDESTKKLLLQQIESILPNHTERVKSIANAEKSLFRRKEILRSKDVLKFEKSLELANKSLKDAEKMQKGDAKGENSLEKVAARAKEYKRDNTASSPRHVRSNDAVSSVVHRSKTRNQALPFVQNRDSIHWDAESDSDEDCSPRNNDFIDITESPVSAFTVVNKSADSQQTNFMNGSHPVYSQSSPVRNHERQVIPNGKIYTSTGSDQSDSRRKDLQQQCQKLQELQQNHRLTSGYPRVTSPTCSSPRSQVTSPRQTIGIEAHNQRVGYNLSPQNDTGSNVPKAAPTRISNGNTAKPVIAPKPQLKMSAQLSLSPQASPHSDEELSSSSESDNEYHIIKEPKSTTV